MKNKEKLEKLLEATFDFLHEDCFPQGQKPKGYEEWKRDFAFHMTDWLDDFEDITALYNNPDLYEPKTVSPILIGFLTHALPHLLAAGRLLLDEIPDPFAPSKADVFHALNHIKT